MIILLRFLEICFFKAGPADLPASPWLLKLSLAGYFSVSVIVNSFENGLFVSLVASLVEMLFLLFLLSLVLSATGFSNRFQQTATAIAGTSTCIGILAMPIMMLFHFLAGGVDIRITVLSVWLMMVLTVWSFAVTAHILKQAMSITTGLAVMATVAYTFILIFIVRAVITGLS